jgi:large subunit ribosomal protein L16
MNRHVKKNGKLWIRVFPDRPITKKPAEIRMGKGKGPVEEWVSVIKPGRVLYEIDGVNEAIARKSMKLAQAKIPIPTKFILKDNDFVY